MRMLVLAGLVAATSLAGPGPANAQGSWCLRYSAGTGVVREQCSFFSFEACAAERPFWGSTAFCSPSPYAGRWSSGYEPRRAHPGKKKRRQHQP